MQSITLDWIKQAVDGRWLTEGSGTVSEVCTDTRKIRPGCLFVALKGERFDGNDFANEALAQGAACVLVSREMALDGPAIWVPDTRLAFGTLSAAYRAQFSPVVVGVTGSVGKTSTKEMIWTVMNHHFRTMKTEGNFNNDIGLPHTLFRLEPEDRGAVIEMGMSARGEISYLTKLCRPTMGVITNIGVSHLENLKTRENILKAKLEILDGMAPDAPLFLNADNDMLAKAIPTLGDRVVTFGIEQPADLTARAIQTGESDLSFEIVEDGKAYPAVLPVLGVHNVYNALAAFGVGRAIGMTPEEICEAFADYQNAGLRQKLMESNGVRIMADCYNASPDSMRSSLSVMGTIACTGKRYAVLGDMLELGEQTKEMHYEVGRMAAQSGVDAVFGFGPLAEEICRGAKDAGIAAHHFTDVDALCEALSDTLQTGDAVGFKASRGMRLERVIQKLFPDTGSEH